MIYVFQVDSGTMMHIDMDLTMKSVQKLKSRVEDLRQIPADKQVLLVSGGEALDSNRNLCSYVGGTDSNPIFLFSTLIIESPDPPISNVEYKSDEDLKARLKECIDLPPTLNTVVIRAKLAKDYQEYAKELQKICEELVLDQHMQQQGWSAVVANLEDITSDFKKRSDIFTKIFDNYVADRETYLGSVKSFNEDIIKLQKIPILPILLEVEKQNIKTEESSTSEDAASTSQITETAKELSLLEWISSADSNSTVDQIYEHVCRDLEQYDVEFFDSLANDVATITKEAEKSEWKEVPGIGERLFGLGNLISSAKQVVQQQIDLAQSFAKNQERVSNLKDVSILPDLCASHRKQLQLIAENHRKLCDIRRRCTKAKEELCVTIYRRLKWVTYVESHITDVDQKLVMNHEHLKRIRRYFSILQQIHVAPSVYMNAVAEVVRRRTFSQSFLVWASELACHLLSIYSEEVTRRKEFQVLFEGHFLTSLFPGTGDMPPAFAIEAPSMFDSGLPKITMEDVEELKKRLPQMADDLNIPDISAIINFFLTRSFVKKEEEKGEEARTVEDKLVQAVSEVGLDSNLDRNLLKGTGSEPCLTTAHGLPHLKDLDRGCESETDTEEFEKVGQSPMELNFDKQLPTSRPGTQDASTSTEVGERSPIPPKKPPRIFQKAYLHSIDDPSNSLQRTLSVSSTASNTESFTNIKNPSLESIDELSSLKNLASNTESCFNSHYQQMQSFNTNTLLLRSKSISPHTPHSPKDLQAVSPISPVLGHQPNNDFINDEYYIDESLPSSLSIETGNSQGEFVKQLDTANNVVALLQDNLQISRSEHEKLKSFLVQMHQLAKEATIQLRTKLTGLREQVLSEKTIVSQHYESLSSSWENLIVERDVLVENIKKDHELTVTDLKKMEEDKNKKIKNLLMEKSDLEAEVLKSCENLNELQETLFRIKEENEKKINVLQEILQEKEIENEKNIKEATDRLNREHAAELQNIRARFKLMTMERSPSDSLLESMSQYHSSPHLLAQMTENFELDKQKAVASALEKENGRWNSILEDKIKELEVKHKQEKDDILEDSIKKICEEKDKQIEVLLEREKNLSNECIKYQNTIQQLTTAESELNSDLIDNINILRQEKENLEIELEKIKSERAADMSTSVTIVEGKDATTSPIKQKIMSRSDFSLTKCGKANIDSCKIGDLVVVLWDPIHENFNILQECRTMYFLHSESLDVMGLQVINSKPNKYYCTGLVIDKEYCHARKSENRYRVSKGTKFFRVKVQPPLSTKDTSRSLHHQKSIAADASIMSQSQSTISTITEIHEDKPDCNSPSPLPTPECSTAIEDKNEDVDEQIGDVSIEKNFAEDSGIVDNIEEATAALDMTLTADNDESSDR